MELSTIFYGYIIFILFASVLTTVVLAEKEKDYSDLHKCFAGAVLFFTLVCVLIEVLGFVICLLGMLFYDISPLFGNLALIILIAAFLSSLLKSYKSITK